MPISIIRHGILVPLPVRLLGETVNLKCAGGKRDGAATNLGGDQ